MENCSSLPVGFGIWEPFSCSLLTKCSGGNPSGWQGWNPGQLPTRQAPSSRAISRGDFLRFLLSSVPGRVQRGHVALCSQGTFPHAAPAALTLTLRSLPLPGKQVQRAALTAGTPSQSNLYHPSRVGLSWAQEHLVCCLEAVERVELDTLRLRNSRG